MKAPEAPGASQPEPGLPALESLLAMVPSGVLAQLDDLFRAKFTGVRRFGEAEAQVRPPPGS